MTFAVGTPFGGSDAGVAVITMGACGGFTSGNLMAPRCADGGVDLDATNCAPDAGTDAGQTGGER